MRMVLLEMDGVRVRGGIIEEEEGGGRGAAGEGEEGDGDEETTIGGMGTDMVVMSDAIAVRFFLAAFLSLPSMYTIRRRVTKGREQVCAGGG